MVFYAQSTSTVMIIRVDFGIKKRHTLINSLLLYKIHREINIVIKYHHQNGAIPGTDLVKNKKQSKNCAFIVLMPILTVQKTRTKLQRTRVENERRQ